MKVLACVVLSVCVNNCLAKDCARCRMVLSQHVRKYQYKGESDRGYIGVSRLEITAEALDGARLETLFNCRAVLFNRYRK